MQRLTVDQFAVGRAPCSRRVRVTAPSRGHQPVGGDTEACGGEIEHGDARFGCGFADRIAPTLSDALPAVMPWSGVSAVSASLTRDARDRNVEFVGDDLRIAVAIPVPSSTLPNFTLTKPARSIASQPSTVAGSPRRPSD